MPIYMSWNNLAVAQNMFFNKANKKQPIWTRMGKQVINSSLATSQAQL